MTTTPLPPHVKKLRDQNRANKSVSNPCARELFDLCTGSHLTTHAFFTDLLTVVSREEAHLKGRGREHLKTVTASVWECLRYGWHCEAFGRPLNATAIQFTTKCRRLKVVLKRAIRAGQAIARRQMDEQTTPK